MTLSHQLAPVSALVDEVLDDLAIIQAGGFSFDMQHRKACLVALELTRSITLMMDPGLQFSDFRRSGWACEADLANHFSFMLFPEMGVNFKQKGTVVLMSKPGRNCADINAGFQARGAKQMPQRVRGEPRNIQSFAGGIDETLRCLN